MSDLKSSSRGINSRGIISPSSRGNGNVQKMSSQDTFNIFDSNARVNLKSPVTVDIRNMRKNDQKIVDSMANNMAFEQS
jgi:hypothetical protein